MSVSVIGRDFLAEVIKKYKLTKVIPELRNYKTSKFLPQRVNIDDLVNQENISNIAVLGSREAAWVPVFDEADVDSR